MNSQLKDVISLVDGVANASSADVPTSRNPRRLTKKWSAPDTEWTDGLVEHDVTTKDGLVYTEDQRWFIRDDTVDPNVHAPPPTINGAYVEVLLSELGITIHDVGDKAAIFKTADGDIPIIKISAADRDQVGVKAYETKYGPMLQEIMEVQAALKRGDYKDGESVGYRALGPHKERFGDDIILFQPAVGNQQHRSISQKLLGKVKDLANAFEGLIKPYLPIREWYINKVLNESFQLEEVKLTGEEGIFAQFVNGLDYWSSLHVDNDFTKA